MKKVNEANYNALSKVIETNETKLWALYRKIGGSYKSTFEALEDMQKLGRLAEALLSVKRQLQVLSEE